MLDFDKITVQHVIPRYVIPRYVIPRYVIPRYVIPRYVIPRSLRRGIPSPNTAEGDSSLALGMTPAHR